MSGSLQTAWDNYDKVYPCKCGKKYGEGDCAHSLSNALIAGNYSTLKNGAGFYACPEGRPIRARELREKFFIENWGNPKYNPPRDGIVPAYQEVKATKDEASQGHVLLIRFKDGKNVDFKGTGDLSKDRRFVGRLHQEFFY